VNHFTRQFFVELFNETFPL